MAGLHPLARGSRLDAILRWMEQEDEDELRPRFDAPTGGRRESPLGTVGESPSALVGDRESSIMKEKNHPDTFSEPRVKSRFR